MNAVSPPIYAPGAQDSPYPPEYIYFPPKRTRRQQIRLFFNRGFYSFFTYAIGAESRRESRFPLAPLF